jgi:hypothetical protein
MPPKSGCPQGFYPFSGRSRGRISSMGMRPRLFMADAGVPAVPLAIPEINAI